MAGTLDFYEETVICPDCENKIEITICVDYNPKLDPEEVAGIAGGQTNCPYCGCKITDLNKKTINFEENGGD